MTQITIRNLLQMKQKKEKIAMLTAYDYPTARIMDQSGLHILLIGDSLGMVVQGHSTTLPVTLDHMVYHTQMVSRAVERAMVVADMPFLTHNVSTEDALRAAGRIMQEGGAQGVKIEGGRELSTTVERLVGAGIPVMGHIGLTPQSVHALGGFHVQGRTEEAAIRLLEDALALQDAGAFAIVLEVVPAEVAQVVTEALSIPTIGIGAGPHCDGQVLVFHDMAGYTSGYIPKHNKAYAHLADILKEAGMKYVEEVQNGEFPGPQQSIHLRSDEKSMLTKLQQHAATHDRQGEMRP
ncbi:3-methyl-2-oxobutanoate hydroxymethyltransferase [Alicyclobacillus tolerans]|uniref:3-methyl-2-oxobutanoate hydroxymethyltransferase n=1 Tax=Alicyclobacillus tolerans TaxID=90970 RepID=A0ABT9LUU9_9BACL|nr:MULTISPECIES: 3-methyl-2-oxobutanoate hydroxymethyltransferase [Alicyclobacillus]MDP9728048.1 3-methyl-2-oxobutanoate hydroxymethyltransferase [Alicyclobacillus tengchongensis]QRF24328.1 3-methyl-2-oxobutanoate hydroxymethyltransferase [Alicyclobacillus sp. TC]